MSELGIIVTLYTCGQDLQAVDEQREGELRQKDEEIRQKDVEMNRMQVCILHEVE